MWGRVIDTRVCVGGGGGADGQQVAVVVVGKVMMCEPLPLSETE